MQQLPSYLANAVLILITVDNLSYSKVLHGPAATICINGFVNETSRLAQGCAGTDIKGTDTIPNTVALTSQTSTSTHL
jgi:hypothetical protein